jgi:hypothetical protein
MKGSSDLSRGFLWRHRCAALQRTRRCAASAIDEWDDSHCSGSEAPRAGALSVVFSIPMTISVRRTWSRRALLGALAATAVFIPVLPAFAGKHSSRHYSRAKTFLESIYQHYVGSSDDSAKGVLLATANSVRAHFTFGTASLINEDRENAGEHGEPPVLECDPFIMRSNWNISDLSTAVKETGVKAFGTVAFIDSGKRAKVVVELLWSGDDWRIAELVWDSGSLRELYRRKAIRDAQSDPR